MFKNSTSHYLTSVKQVSSILVAASPKIQKWISDAATDDPESLDTFLQINDQINTVLARYEAFKAGNYNFNPLPEEAAGPSLIDLDESAPATTTTTSGAVDDLASLFAANPVQAPPQQQQQWGMPPIGYGVQQQPPQQAIGGYAMQQQPPYSYQQQPPPQQWGMPPQGYQAQSPPQQQQPHAPTPLFHNGAAFASPPHLQQHSQSATPPASIVLPGTPGPAIATAHIGNGLGKGGPVQQQSPPWLASAASPPQPVMQPMAAAVSQPSAPAQQQQHSKDPFADLAGLF